MERAGKVDDLHAPVRQVQWALFRFPGKLVGVRGRKQRALENRSLRQGLGRCERLPGKAAQRSKRRLVATWRRPLLYRSLLQTGLLETRRQRVARVRLSSFGGRKNPDAG